MLHKSELQLKGWTKFSLDNDIVHWITEALPYCRMISEDKKNIKNWMRCGGTCLLYTSPSPRDATLSRMPSSA